MIIASILFIPFYILGGQGHKWSKKWVSTGGLALSLILDAIFRHYLSWIFGIGALSYLLASNSFAYGEKFTQGKLWKKILFRGLCGLMYGISGLIIGIATHHIVLGVLQLILPVLGSILFGAFNPFGSKLGNWSTILEDLCISITYVILIPFMVI